MKYYKGLLGDKCQGLVTVPAHSVQCHNIIWKFSSWNNSEQRIHCVTVLSRLQNNCSHINLFISRPISKE